MRATFFVACGLLLLLAAFGWRYLPDYRRAQVRELIGLPAFSHQPSPVETTFEPENAEIATICEHVTSLGGRFDDCTSHFTRIARLDGRELWTLRRDCMLSARELDVLFRCNRAHHPNWPDV